MAAQHILFACPRPAPAAKRPKTALAGNPMIATCGAGPDGAKCQTCTHFTTLDFTTGKTHKCDLASGAAGAKTDWHVRWPACGRYEPLGFTYHAVTRPKRRTGREIIQAIREAQAAPTTGEITAIMVSPAPEIAEPLAEPTPDEMADILVSAKLGGSFTPSTYQRDVFRFILTGHGDALVNAVAGSGKTTTLVQAAKLLPASASAIFLAFNKHIAEELALKLRGTPMTAKTIHSVGLACVQANVTPKLQIDGRKYNKLAREMVTQELVREYGKEQRLASDMLTKLANFARLTLVETDDLAALDAMMAHYDISTDGLDDDTVARIMGAVGELLARGAQHAQKSGLIDFTDMIWLPTFLNLTPIRYDWLFVDEAQDENAAQRELVLRMRAPGGRMVFVGDPRQAIYSFAGADADAFWRIQQRTGAIEMPLSVCYRCPPNVVALAREIVPHIEAAPGVPAGVVGHISESELPTAVRPGDLILCRLTAPLISLCIRLIQRRVAARVRGRDIGKQLTDVVKAVTELDGYAWEMFPQKICDWRDIQLRKLGAREGTEQQIESLLDRVDAIQTCYDSFQASDAADLSRQLEELFDDGKPAVMLSTVHRAKGLEEERVFILRPDKLPLIWPKQQAHQLEQEFNLRYVAITRAKRELYFVDGGAPVQATLPEGGDAPTK